MKKPEKTNNNFNLPKEYRNSIKYGDHYYVSIEYYKNQNNPAIKSFSIDEYSVCLNKVSKELNLNYSNYLVKSIM